MKYKNLLTAGALAFALTPAAAHEVRIGLVTTLSGPVGALGQHVRDGFALGVEEAGGKLGGLDTTVIVEDDQLKPEAGRQATNKLIGRDKIHILTGPVVSNVAMALAKPAQDSDVIFISPNAGPALLAGKLCSPSFFTTAGQNDQSHEAMGAYLQQQGIKNVYLIALNYNAGKEALSGFKRMYKGEIIDEVYAAQTQMDFSAEITQIQAANPDAVYVFMAGGMGINFVKQYAQAGLSDKIPLYSAFVIDSITLPAIGEAAVGTYQTNLWNADLPNAANKQFVERFRAKFGYEPSNFAAQSYDTARLIDSALRKTGTADDKDLLIAALQEASFDSVRGPFSFNVNNFPIANFYLLKVVKDDDGTIRQVTEKIALEKAKDAYYTECEMT
ncbi:ABC transporter substrate-binding protein [Pusillimonas noertemannii]|uniref:Amino acid/amide ABC transporter substrate-binding protein (HAAT family) n=1 Tax=Pusillimonas noertemannii TaxID=305977 RepID=A0A2U1CKY4_9BURK|nr:ABC transporter substrate-binding protein [Pusillimonas noertemannii]NYT69210.1 ABC transporter substrate-binding protein [Pusillimonas noertemannii]PVY61679.1 amino acid/amide ABC transporter substrate-binding protein (HAAT family) [Pusillimonas noertemannii]TFL09620.1 ABC transporter substrate-binding protein [Pusillimonas noertemannii]